jgi:mRNA-degrading endonuclease RelE of RelBE toxin-antitoxin system
MTRYTVVWSQEAQDQLADLWLDSPNRQAVTRASDAVDRMLAGDPVAQSFDVREGLRGLRVPPLRVIFLVREADRIVDVVRVRLD